nr:MAG TPA: tail length tape measure protein [Caudoviricetes sp.]
MMQQGGYQIQDFIVQVQGGQSALVAFSQQGSQLASVFSPVAGAVLTIATVIAGSLIASLGNGKNAVDSLKEAIATMDSVVSVSSSGVAVYTDKFARLAKVNASVATLMRQQAQLELQAALSKVSAEVTKASSDFIGFGDSLVSSLGGGYASVKLFNDYMSQLNITTDSWTEAIKQAAAAGDGGKTSMNGMIATVGALASKFQLSDQQAFEFAKQLSDIAKNPSDEKLKALIATLQRVSEGTSRGAETAREYADRLLAIVTSSADATQRLKILKQMTYELTNSQDKALQQAKQTLFIERQTGVEKQKALAWRDAENQGLKAGTQAFRDYYNVRLQTYQQQEKNAQALKDERSAQSAATSEAKKAATEQENIANKLEQLRQKSLLTAESTKELSREQSILAAQQSLGKGATQEQINLAGQYAAKAWDNANALKAQAEAEKQKQKAESDYTKLRGQASPVAGVDSNYQQDMQALNAYAQFYPQKIAEIEQTRAAIEAQYRQQRMEAMWQEWSQQSAATQAAAAAFDAFGQTASNALTGILTGSMSASDALRSIGSTVLNAVINSFVQMGAEWVKSAVMGQTAQVSAIAATTAAQTAGLATTTAASTTAAATTTAAWTPAAIMASIGSFGGAAAIGIGAVLGAMALAGKRKNGGPVSAGSMYQVGENGLPEIFQASNGNQYMIPGDSGRVISNKDISGEGNGGLVIYNSVQNYTSSNVTTTATDNGDGSVTIETIVADIEAGGPISQAITSNTTATRRATE